MPVISNETVNMLAPHIFELVKGVFKSRREPEPLHAGRPGEEPSATLGRDVAELQDIAARQAAALSEVAQAMDARFTQVQAELKTQRMISIGAVVLAIIATIVAIAK